VLVAITKKWPLERMRLIQAAGHDTLGENRVQEAALKIPDLAPATWHVVGHLQKNKVAKAIELFDVIESVDSVRLARRLHLEAEKAERVDVPILVQVNAGGEQQKSGLEPAELVDAVGAMLDLGRVRVLGLMTMAPFTVEERVLRRTFSTARECLARCRAELPGFDGQTLSMGMSNDFEIAVEEGSTEVRLGTVLLGERPEVRWT
jgi:pyridoxal phosphate enzyme (YggS family)